MNRKQRRILASLRRRGKELEMALDKNDPTLQEYLQACAALGETYLNIDSHKERAEELKKKIKDLLKQLKDKEAASNAEKQSDSNIPSGAGNPVSAPAVNP